MCLLYLLVPHTFSVRITNKRQWSLEGRAEQPLAGMKSGLSGSSWCDWNDVSGSVPVILPIWCSSPHPGGCLSQIVLDLGHVVFLPLLSDYPNGQGDCKIQGAHRNLGGSTWRDAHGTRDLWSNSPHLLSSLELTRVHSRKQRIVCMLVDFPLPSTLVQLRFPTNVRTPKA